MKAVGYQQSLPSDNPKALVDIELKRPTPGATDLLVQISAIAVNPVDTKIRQRTEPESGYKVLGWDAVGTVVETGSSASGFSTGDRVWFAGDVTRSGCNAEFQCVDYRIAAKAPHSLTDEQAAALPLTSITAWELLFERLQIQQPGKPRTLLVIGGAGGVGSILIQLAKTFSQATVIATASRPESQQWVTSLGADHVIDHSQDLTAQINALNIGAITDAACLTHTDQHFSNVAEIIAPQGRVALIDDPEQDIDVSLLKQKSVSLHWEFMFTRSMFATDDMIEQQRLLEQVAAAVDAGKLVTTVGKNYGTINAENLRRAHHDIEQHKTIGKIVLVGF
ncbi:zinc-binding alcohol dehydrogenase family protein [Idiomarina tyrosinivorans]|uniref:Zinc-type alcohol dehydrogenase-like protein n=1 Tax=Idiomarina tyrosinivorans TaxID=1445662 RepID=A0A432ZTF4_9GAMM|nr:zinc-binding alcohol dehydrogenase family protein [Idiomarina tyrosinivorans]RUO81214.1 zinc-binding alcohol dehydrogenase family protein [Idiomarina tyrosinivorans]